jgi:hypothetical protein
MTCSEAVIAHHRSRPGQTRSSASMGILVKSPSDTSKPAVACLKACWMTSPAYAGAGPKHPMVPSFRLRTFAPVRWPSDNALSYGGLADTQGSGGLVVTRTVSFLRRYLAASCGLRAGRTSRPRRGRPRRTCSGSVCGAGVPVTAPVSGMPVGPGRLHQTCARPARQQPGSQVTALTRAAASGNRASGHLTDLLGGDEVGFADQAWCARRAEITQPSGRFHRCTCR